METSHLIKQETIFSLESSHDFAKWKLIVAAGLAAAGLGLMSAQGQAWLLLLIPYACGYVDLYSYQDLIRIIVVSRFFQEHHDDALLAAWEQHCQQLHAQYRVFNLAHYAQIGGSLVLSLAPVITCVEFFRAKDWSWLTVAIVLWLGGLCLIVGLWFYYRSKLKKANEGSINRAASQATAGA